MRSASTARATTDDNRKRTDCRTDGEHEAADQQTNPWPGLWGYCCSRFCNERKSTASVFWCSMMMGNSELHGTYKISKSGNPLKACSSTHVISLLSSCRDLIEATPLKIRLPIEFNWLCDKSLWKKLKTEMVKSLQWEESQNHSPTIKEVQGTAQCQRNLIRNLQPL